MAHGDGMHSRMGCIEHRERGGMIFKRQHELPVVDPFDRPAMDFVADMYMHNLIRRRTTDDGARPFGIHEGAEKSHVWRRGRFRRQRRYGGSRRRIGLAAAAGEQRAFAGSDEFVKRMRGQWISERGGRILRRRHFVGADRCRTDGGRGNNGEDCQTTYRRDAYHQAPYHQEVTHRIVVRNGRSARRLSAAAQPRCRYA